MARTAAHWNGKMCIRDRGASGKLHGKVTAKEVAEQLYKLTGTEIDKKKIEMPASIKEFGSYDAKVRLHVGVVAAFKVKVEEAPL